MGKKDETLSTRFPGRDKNAANTKISYPWVVELSETKKSGKKRN